jgi:RNA polymerase sigma-70 factor (ECF subfamily)
LPRTTGQPTADAIRSRDRDAWAAFYDAHVRDVYAVIWHLVRGDSALAEELNQAVWLSAIESAERFDPQRGTLPGWLIGIARNQVALHFRRRAMQRAVDANLAESQPAGAVESRSVPDQASLRSEQLCQVRAALAQLATDRRKLIEGKYVEGLSVRQLAERSGKSAKAVESLLQRARTELRRLLNNSAE